MPARPNPQKVLKQTRALAKRAEARLRKSAEKVGRVLEQNLRLTFSEREQYCSEHAALQSMASGMRVVGNEFIPTPPAALRKKTLRTGRPSKKELARGARAKAKSEKESP